MSWYDLWSNWLNTTIRVLSSECNQSNVGFYFFKSNTDRDKSKYVFGRIKHHEHKMHWTKTHRNRRVLV